MNNKGFAESSLPIIGAVIIVTVVLGGIIAATSNNPVTAPVPQISPTPSITKPLSFETFYLDEYNEPLALDNMEESILRNEARMDSMVDQIDSDIMMLDQINQSL